MTNRKRANRDWQCWCKRATSMMLSVMLMATSVGVGVLAGSGVTTAEAVRPFDNPTACITHDASIEFDYLRLIQRTIGSGTELLTAMEELATVMSFAGCNSFMSDSDVFNINGELELKDGKIASKQKPVVTEKTQIKVLAQTEMASKLFRVALDVGGRDSCRNMISNYVTADGLTQRDVATEPALLNLIRRGYRGEFYDKHPTLLKEAILAAFPELTEADRKQLYANWEWLMVSKEGLCSRDTSKSKTMPAKVKDAVKAAGLAELASSGGSPDRIQGRMYDVYNLLKRTAGYLYAVPNEYGRVAAAAAAANEGITSLLTIGEQKFLSYNPNVRLSSIDPATAESRLPLERLVPTPAVPTCFGVEMLPIAFEDAATICASITSEMYPEITKAIQDQWRTLQKYKSTDFVDVSKRFGAIKETNLDAKKVQQAAIAKLGSIATELEPTGKGIAELDKVAAFSAALNPSGSIKLQALDYMTYYTKQYTQYQSDKNYALFYTKMMNFILSDSTRAEWFRQGSPASPAPPLDNGEIASHIRQYLYDPDCSYFWVTELNDLIGILQVYCDSKSQGTIIQETFVTVGLSIITTTGVAPPDELLQSIQNFNYHYIMLQTIRQSNNSLNIDTACKQLGIKTKNAASLLDALVCDTGATKRGALEVKGSQFATTLDGLRAEYAQWLPPVTTDANGAGTADSMRGKFKPMAANLNTLFGSGCDNCNTVAGIASGFKAWEKPWKTQAPLSLPSQIISCMRNDTTGMLSKWKPIAGLPDVLLGMFHEDRSAKVEDSKYSPLVGAINKLATLNRKDPPESLTQLERNLMRVYADSILDTKMKNVSGADSPADLETIHDRLRHHSLDPQTHAGVEFEKQYAALQIPDGASASAPSVSYLHDFYTLLRNVLMKDEGNPYASTKESAESAEFSFSWVTTSKVYEDTELITSQKNVEKVYNKLKSAKEKNSSLEPLEDPLKALVLRGRESQCTITLEDPTEYTYELPTDEFRLKLMSEYLYNQQMVDTRYQLAVEILEYCDSLPDDKRSEQCIALSKSYKIEPQTMADKNARANKLLEHLAKEHLGMKVEDTPADRPPESSSSGSEWNANDQKLNFQGLVAYRPEVFEAIDDVAKVIENAPKGILNTFIRDSLKKEMEVDFMGSMLAVIFYTVGEILLLMVFSYTSLFVLVRSSGFVPKSWFIFATAGKLDPYDISIPRFVLGAVIVTAIATIFVSGMAYSFATWLVSNIIFYTHLA